jgi:hypothetical protein
MATGNPERPGPICIQKVSTVPPSRGASRNRHVVLVMGDDL